MIIFESERDLVVSLDHHDALARRCASGELSFEDFCTEYHDYYAYRALDGHESDEEERMLLLKHEKRIEVHRIIAAEILVGICSEKDAQLKIYQRAGRFGSVEAVRKLRDVVSRYL